MNTKDVILVVAGVAVGYLLVGYLNKSKDSSTTGSIGSNSEQSADPPATTNPKIDACNKEVADFMASANFIVGADLGAIRKERFNACMAKNA
jgi:hypothetical protein